MQQWCKVSEASSYYQLLLKQNVLIHLHKAQVCLAKLIISDFLNILRGGFKVIVLWLSINIRSFPISY